ncbi:hypothetical protein [Flaviaesturariibacter terrae]
MNRNTENSSSQNRQAAGRQESQGRNTPAGSGNNSQDLSDSRTGQQRVSSREGAGATETESERANRNEDEGVRGGNSSI